MSSLNNYESSNNIMPNHTTERMQHHPGNKNNFSKGETFCSIENKKSV